MWQKKKNITDMNVLEQIDETKWIMNMLKCLLYVNKYETYRYQ